ncbi:UbiA prenyltransferase family protein [Sutcliffiella deserti]|uniref:hypothetical protein n=1 Tax=Sutcliffiella deserti TaxID=2875501 RepID=UPI001CBF65DE|nr:hypothetical protein [Sutcliffiella deserti]
MKKHNKVGRVLFFIGTFFTAFGLAFRFLSDTPEPFFTFSIPLIIAGIILLVASNFFKVSKDNSGEWREKYGALLVAVSCLSSAIVTWGNNWILTGILVLGVLVCGTMGIYEVKDARTKRN